jgi:hypothetical protein
MRKCAVTQTRTKYISATKASFEFIYIYTRARVLSSWIWSIDLWSNGGKKVKALHHFCSARPLTRKWRWQATNGSIWYAGGPSSSSDSDIWRRHCTALYVSTHDGLPRHIITVRTYPRQDGKPILTFSIFGVVSQNLLYVPVQTSSTQALCINKLLLLSFFKNLYH